MLLIIKRRYPTHIYHMSLNPIVLFPSPLSTQPSLTLYLTLNSDKQQITQKALNADVIHTDRHSGSARIAATAAPSLSTAPTFGIFVFNMSF